MAVFRTTVDLRFNAGAGRGTNTWSVRTLGDADTNVQVAGVMEYVRQFYADLIALVPSSSTFQWDGTFLELGTTTPEYVEPASPWTVTGSGTPNSYGPAPAMACISWRTSLATRRGRGRTFFGPLSPGVFGADGTINDGQLTVIRNAAADLVSLSLQDSINGAVGVWSELDSVHRDFVGSSVNDQAAVLRSRR